MKVTTLASHAVDTSWLMTYVFLKESNAVGAPSLKEEMEKRGAGNTLAPVCLVGLDTKSGWK